MIVAVIRVTRHFLPVVSEDGQHQTFETIFYVGDVEYPSHVRVDVVELHEESREYRKW